MIIGIASASTNAALGTLTYNGRWYKYAIHQDHVYRGVADSGLEQIELFDSVSKCSNLLMGLCQLRVDTLEIALCICTSGLEIALSGRANGLDLTREISASGIDRLRERHDLSVLECRCCRQVAHNRGGARRFALGHALEGVAKFRSQHRVDDGKCARASLDARLVGNGGIDKGGRGNGSGGGDNGSNNSIRLNRPVELKVLGGGNDKG